MRGDGADGDVDADGDARARAPSTSSRGDAGATATAATATEDGGASADLAAAAPPPPPASASSSQRATTMKRGRDFDAKDVFRRGGPKATRAEQTPGVDGADAATVDADADAPADADADANANARAPAEENGSLSRHPRLATKLRTLCAAYACKLGAAPGGVSVAMWRPRERVAELVRMRGKHFVKFGYAAGSRTFLHAEEALFLVETERLALLAPGATSTPLSVHAVRSLAMGGGGGGSRFSIPNPLTPSRYLVFAHLARMGYIVRRFNSPWTWNRDTASDAARDRGGEGGLNSKTTATDDERDEWSGRERDVDHAWMMGEGAWDVRGRRRRARHPRSAPSAPEEGVDVDVDVGTPSNPSEEPAEPSSEASRWWPAAGSANHSWLPATSAAVVAAAARASKASKAAAAAGGGAANALATPGTAARTGTGTLPLYAVYFPNKARPTSRRFPCDRVRVVNFIP